MMLKSIAFSIILKLMKNCGLRFHDCICAFGEDPASNEHVRKAHDVWHSEGEIEIDTIAVVSASDEGAYVQAWVWIGKADLKGVSEG